MMFEKQYVIKTFNKILKDAGDPPLTISSRNFFENQTGRIGKRTCGMANHALNIIWINKSHPNISELEDTIWHEILHCLFPRSAEWWIELSARKLSRNNYGESGLHSEKLNKKLSDVPSRTQLIKMVKSTSDVMNGKVK